MKTDLLILGKGDDIITMILDNLSSSGISEDITIFNNLDLPIISKVEHPDFRLNFLSKLNIFDFNSWILGLYKPEFKKKIIESLQIYDSDRFISVIHHGFNISKTSQLGKGCLINCGVSIAAQTTLGNFVSVNRNSSIGHHTQISDYVSINPGCNIAGHCYIGESTTIGMGSQILNGVTIGKNVVIGAGSIVTRDIPDGVVAWGSPCKIKK